MIYRGLKRVLGLVQLVNMFMSCFRYEEAKEVNQELNIAMETKNNQMAEDLTRKCMKQFSTLLELTSET